LEIIEVNPRDCIRWKYADRSLFEYGDTNLLAEDIKRNGQIEPVFKPGNDLKMACAF